MRKFTKLGFFVLGQAVALSAMAQSCPNNLLTSSSGYYGGFEAGAGNFASANASTDYKLGMPRNGNYEVVKKPSDAGGGGYLQLAPKSGQYLMVSHTRSAKNERIWYKTIAVTPGDTYQFCAWIANIKEEPVKGFSVSLKVNNTVIASKTAVYGWSEVCGSYTVPAGVTSIQFAIVDLNAHVGPSHFLALDDICITKQNNTLRLGNLFFNDRNGSGLRDPGEPGVGGVEISLYTDNDANDLPDGPAIRTTVTDQNGNYLFNNLAPGRYIASVPVLPGYGQTPNFTTGGIIPNPNATTGSSSLLPDENRDNDNNLVRLVGNNIAGQGVLFTKAITLAPGTEPTDDGDDSNGNLTFDLAQCGNTNVGDFVWFDANCNGVQDAHETGLADVMVSVQFQDGTVATTTTDHDGKYMFMSLGTGPHVFTFTTPAGYKPSPANATNDEHDSDPVNGTFTLQVPANPPGTADFTNDAGFCLATAPRGIVSNNIVSSQVTTKIQKVYPNPMVNSLTINFSSNTTQTVNCRLVDMSGRVVATQASKVQPGTNIIQLNNLGKIPAGNYMLQVFSQQGLFSEKLKK